MSEVNGPNFNINQVNYKNLPKQNQENQTEEKENDAHTIDDFGDPKAEALGRSMLIKNADSTNNDLKVLLENPQVAENSDKMFETFYSEAQKAGLENPYEEASTFATDSIK